MNLIRRSCAILIAAVLLPASAAFADPSPISGTGANAQPDPPLSSAERQELAEKDAARVVRQRKNTSLAALPASGKATKLEHAGQQKPNYCGPASAVMTLSSLGSRHTQDELAALIMAKRQTSPRSKTYVYAATDWQMLKAGLNRILSHEGYDVQFARVSVPAGGGSDHDLREFKARVTDAIHSNYAPIVGVGLSHADTRRTQVEYPPSTIGSSELPTPRLGTSQ